MAGQGQILASHPGLLDDNRVNDPRPISSRTPQTGSLFAGSVRATERNCTGPAKLRRAGKTENPAHIRRKSANVLPYLGHAKVRIMKGISIVVATVAALGMS